MFLYPQGFSRTAPADLFDLPDKPMPPGPMVEPDGIERMAQNHRPHGGARRDRTDDLMLAKHALSQLSYGPFGWPPRE